MSKKTKLPQHLEEFFAANPDWAPFMDLIVVPPSAADIVEAFPDAEGCDMLRREDRWVAAHVSMYSLYMRIRTEGETHRWAEMVALGEPPRIMTDSVYLADHPGGKMPKIVRDLMVAHSKRNGFTPGDSDVYSEGLARFPGDPLAWIPPTGGRGHVKKVLDARGLANYGDVKTKAAEPLTDPFESAPALAPDIIRANGRRMLQENPALRTKKPQEIRDMVLAKHGPQS